VGSGAEFVNVQPGPPRPGAVQLGSRDWIPRPPLHLRGAFLLRELVRRPGSPPWPSP